MLLHGLGLGLDPLEKDKGREPLRFLGDTLIHSESSLSYNVEEDVDSVGEDALEVDGVGVLTLCRVRGTNDLKEEPRLSLPLELDALGIAIGLDILTEGYINSRSVLNVV